LEAQLVAERSKPINSATVTTRYQHSDLRGSPTVVTNAAGTQIERSIEQPFGAPYDGIYRDGPGFTGHATDAASGLSYMQQRYYDLIAIRFLSVDPAQSEFSRYSYGANNPYKYVDPDGREITYSFQNGATLLDGIETMSYLLNSQTAAGEISQLQSRPPI
jgi:RHS repeat-associated protein